MLSVELYVARRQMQSTNVVEVEQHRDSQISTLSLLFVHNAFSRSLFVLARDHYCDRSTARWAEAHGPASGDEYEYRNSDSHLILPRRWCNRLIVVNQRWDP